MGDFQEPLFIAQFQLLFQPQLGDQTLQSSRRESGHVTQMGLVQRGQIEAAAHAPIKDKGRFGDPKAPPQRLQEPLEGLRVVAVAPQHGHVQGQPFGVRRHRQDNLRPITPMIAAVAVASQVLGALAFEVDAGQIIEHQPHGLGEGSLIELLFQPDPVAVELVHGVVNIIFVEAFLRIEPAGLRQPGALGHLGQGELGARKEQAAENHGLQQSPLPG